MALFFKYQPFFTFPVIASALITESLYFTQMCTDTRVKHTEITGSMCPIFSHLWTFSDNDVCNFLIQSSQLYMILDLLSTDRET